jgi:hypothetical protein
MTEGKELRIATGSCQKLSPHRLAHFCWNSLYLIKELLGDFSGVEPPVPIPNTEVKRSSADDT